MKTLKQLLDEAGVPEFATNPPWTRVFRAVDVSAVLQHGTFTWHAGDIWRADLLPRKALGLSNLLWFVFDEIHPPKIDGWELAEPLPRAVTVCGTPHCHIGGNGAVYTNSYVPENPVWIMKKSAPKFREHRKPTPEELEAAGLELDGDEPRDVKKGDYVACDYFFNSQFIIRKKCDKIGSDDDGKRWHVKPVQNPPRPAEPIYGLGPRMYRIAEDKPRRPRAGEMYFCPFDGVACSSEVGLTADDAHFSGRRWILKPVVDDETDDTESGTVRRMSIVGKLAALRRQLERPVSDKCAIAAALEFVDECETFIGVKREEE